jgi:hypothetical protein
LESVGVLELAPPPLLEEPPEELALVVVDVPLVVPPDVFFVSSSESLEEQPLMNVANRIVAESELTRKVRAVMSAFFTFSLQFAVKRRVTLAKLHEWRSECHEARHSAIITSCLRWGIA